MMQMIRRTRSSAQACSALAGVLAIHHVAWFVSFLGVPTALAAWSWGLPQPAQCSTPAIVGGSCREGAVISAGEQCTVDCEVGLTFPCEAPRCPPSDGTLQNDLDGEFDWWNYCGLGSTCQNGPLAILGDFLCVDATAADRFSCSALEFAVDFQEPPSWDWAIAVICGAMVSITMIALLSQFCLPVESSLHKVLCNAPKPFKAWTLSGLIGCVAFGLLLIVVVFMLQQSSAGQAPWGKRPQALADALGLVAGLCMPLPVLWSFMRYGVHHLFGMSLESGWRVHIALGTLFLVFASLHGVLELTHEDVDKRWKLISENNKLILGLVALSIFIAAVLAADLHILFPSIPRGYSMFKLTHILVVPAYVVAIRHMSETVRLKAYKFEATAWGEMRDFNLLMLIAIVVLVCWALQRVYSIVSAFIIRPELLSAEATPDGHVFLTVKRNGYKSAPGQWAHMYAGKDPIPHPFTIVSHPDREDCMQFLIRATGTFTSELHQACWEDRLPHLSFGGPYGRPLLGKNSDMTYLRALCFVCGGVGITPVLSLAKAAVDSGKQVSLYWSLRSPAMLTKCVPLLLNFSTSELTKGVHVVITGHKEETLDVPGVPIQTQRTPLKDWIEEQGEMMRAVGIRHVGLFICGPQPLTEEASEAAREGFGRVRWHIHSEEFRFLPFTQACAKKVKAYRDSARGGGGTHRASRIIEPPLEPDAQLIGSQTDAASAS